MKKTFAALIALILAASLPYALGGRLGVPSFDAYRLKSSLLQDHRQLYKRLRDTIQRHDCDLLSAAPSETPHLRLLLSDADVRHFDDLYAKFRDPRYGVQYYATHNDWRKAHMEFEGQTYEIQIKSHGNNPTDHQVGKYISYAIRLKDHENLFSTTRFSLIIRNRVQSYRQAIAHLAHYCELIHQDTDLVRVTVNNWKDKLYFFHPHYDDEFFDRGGRSSLRVFRREVSATRASYKSMVNIRARTDDVFSPSVYRRDFHAILDERQYPAAQKREIIARHEALNKAILAHDSEGIATFFDLDYITSFEAFRTLIGAAQHGFHSEADHYLAYDFASGRFFPVVTDDIYWRRIALAEDQAVEEFLDVRRTADGDKVLGMFGLLSQNDTVRHLKYRKVYQALSQESEIVGAHQDVMAEFDRLHALGRLKTILRPLGLSGFPVQSKRNFPVLRKYLENAEPEVLVKQYADVLTWEIRPCSMVGVTIAGLQTDQKAGARRRILVAELTDGAQPTQLYSGIVTGNDVPSGLKSLVLSDTLDHSSRRLARTYVVEVQLLDRPDASQVVGAPELRLVNSVTGAPVSAKVRRETMKGEPALIAHDQLPEPHDLARFKEVLDFEVDDNDFIVRPGVYRINEDIILPDGLRFVLQSGCTLLLGPDVLLLGKNGIEVRGTESDPVVIEALDADQPFGAVAILGTRDTASVIEHLALRGGNERIGEGAYFSGALSIYHNGFVQIKHSTISECHADDGLNIKYANVLIEGTQFYDNHADQVDLDACNALIVDSQFCNGGSSANGDGLDVSHSSVLVADCRFVDIADKGLSVGEKSTAYIVGNEVSSNGIGCAVKDSSICYLYDNAFRGNAADVSLYKEKDIWTSPTCYLARPIGGNAYVDYRRDDSSQMVPTVLPETGARELDDALRDAKRAAGSGREAVHRSLADARRVFDKQRVVNELFVLER